MCACIIIKTCPSPPKQRAQSCLSMPAVTWPTNGPTGITSPLARSTLRNLSLTWGELSRTSWELRAEVTHRPTATVASVKLTEPNLSRFHREPEHLQLPPRTPRGDSSCQIAFITREESVLIKDPNKVREVDLLCCSHLSSDNIVGAGTKISPLPFAHI